MSDQEGHAAALEGVAIIGMAGRFPGSRSVAEFWRNQLEGIESISHFRLEDLEYLEQAGVANDPRYVTARSVLTTLIFSMLISSALIRARPN